MTGEEERDRLTPLERIRRCRTLVDCFRFTEPDRPFVTMWIADSESETVSFAEFLARSQGFASLYRREGVASGDSIALILPQGVDLMSGFVGAILIGAIPTILAFPNFKINPDKYREGLQGVTSNIGARLTILDESFPPDYCENISDPRHHKLLRLSGGAPKPEGIDLPEGSPATEIALIQHSAGTTGLQKGVALTHRVLLNQLTALAHALRLSNEDVVVSWLPLYHDMGLVACFLLPLVAGIPVVMQSPVDWVLRPGTFLELISKFRGTLGWVPNFAFQFMARRIPDEEKRLLDLSSLRALTTTSEPIRKQSLQEFELSFRNCGLALNAVQTSYGMAESVFAVTQSVLGERPRVVHVHKERLHQTGQIGLVPEDHPKAYPLVSCGHSLGTNCIKIVGSKEEPLPDGQVGEIVVQTDYLFSGYYRRPDLTGQVLRGNWYWTGDSGFMLGSDLFVIGRKDDMIIVGGRNLYPQDLEEIAFRHPLVRDGRAVAFGLENKDLGTRDVVVIAEVSDESELGAKDQIAREIRQDLLLEVGIAPRYVEVVPPRWLIKSTAGKPARATNRTRFLELHPELESD